uniref:SPATA31 domain-containing protein n=1 Tax=Terrapene triunguis TaxID=2587831 RepID=A0A674JIW1_9SAUR
MSGQEAKRQRDRESAAPKAAGKALTSLAGRAPVRVSPGALRVPGRIELAEVETPFLQSDVRASLERHVQVKRLQHTLGLPCTLQNTLKIFMPPAPKPTARRPSGAGSVVTIPQALPFLSVGSRTELERHLQRMVHLKRWGMPRRIQESLRLLMPATPPHPRLGPRPSGRWAPKGPGPVTRAAQTPCPPVPHTPFVAPEGRELLERHVLRMRLQHEWGLPGLVRRSLRCFMPPPPTRPRPQGSVRPAAMELRVSSGAPPIPLATKRELEAHIRRRVAERRWGFPRRVRESLRGFMPPTTAALGTHPDTRGRRASRLLRGLSARRAPRESPSRGAPVGPAAVAVSLAGPLGTAWSQQLSRDTCHQLLERHVTRKKIEIRLGLIPRRAQHSQEAARQAGKLPLPRLIRPGQRSLEQRPRELFFLEQATSDHLELNLLHKHLSFRWGLPTLYRHARTASRPAPEGPSLAREHLAPPRAAAHRLDIHLAQKALGSFILPPCVIRSQAVYADMAAERQRAAAQEGRREMNIRLQRRRS